MNNGREDKTGAEGAGYSHPSGSGILYAGCAAVALITFLVYLPSLGGGFVWDDELYVKGNLRIRSFDLEFLGFAFTSFVAGNWHPLTMVSLALDHAAWGLNPFGYHLTNVILHALNTFLVAFIVIRLVTIRLVRAGGGGTSKGSACLTPVIAGVVAALLFGTHPIHVESVAWVSERKDVLSALFFLLTVASYLRYAENLSGDKVKGGYGPYLLTLFFFALALMSKPMAVTLPVVLLILDWYPLGRFSKGLVGGGGEPGGKTGRALAEKVPFFLMSLASSVITVIAQHSEGAVAALETHAPLTRLLVAARAYIFYLYKTVYPLELAPFYPYPRDVSLFSLEYASGVVLLLAITGVCFITFKKRRLFTALWLYYLVTLAPVIGIIQVGRQAAADRYMYLPSVAPFLLIGVGVAYLCANSEKRGVRVAVLVAVVLAISLFSCKTVYQTRIWKDEPTLWKHAISLYPESSALGHYNLGRVYDQQGLVDTAAGHYRASLEADPNYFNAHVNLGFVYYNQGYIDEAIGEYLLALKLRPTDAAALNNLGLAYDSKGRFSDAVALYKEAVEMDPAYAEARVNLGSSYARLGQLERAAMEFKEALKLRPDFVDARYNLGLAFQRQGAFEAARVELTEALRLSPDLPEAHNSLGFVLLRLGDIHAAKQSFKEAIRINPAFAEAHFNLGLALARRGVSGKPGEPVEPAEIAEAIREIEEALRLKPDLVGAQAVLKSLKAPSAP